MSDERPPQQRLVCKEGVLEPAPSEAPWLSNVVADGGDLVVVGHAPGLLVAASERPPSPWLACSLDVVTTAELVTLLVSVRKTGALLVKDPRGTRRLFFEQGQYTGAMSAHKDDRLGDVLWREGRISLDQLMIAGESLGPGKRIGRVLVELGYLEPKDLRPALHRQAQHIFEAACLEPEGEALFLEGARHPNPVRFGVATERMIDDALALYAEQARLLRVLAPLDEPSAAIQPRPAGTLSEAEEAMLQLATSAQTPLTRAQLLDKSGLGRLHGLRALERLASRGFLAKPSAKAAAPDRPSRLHRLCEGVNLVMDALGWTGGQDGHPVRNFLASPPPHLADALSGLSLAEPLDPGAIELQAQFGEGGLETMESALLVVLDVALFEARDTLEAEEVEELQAAVAELDVF